MARAVSGPTLFLIPARGGSKRIPGKNLRSLAGIPLVGWAVRIARAAARPGDLVVCSTDDPATADAARAWGAEILERPAELATDEATSLSVVLHALDAVGPLGIAPDALELVVLLQPTSPLTDPADLAGAVELARSTGRSVTSVVAGHPAAWHRQRDADGALQVRPGGEAARHLLTGGFYVTPPAALRQAGMFVEPGVTLGVEIPLDRAIDIDEPADLVAAAGTLAARPVAPFVVGDRTVEAGRTLVIAEAGVNHDGDVEVARRLIDAAADAGADAVKFQTFLPEALAAPAAPTAAYQRDHDGGDDQRAMLERLALPAAAWADLQAHARERGVVFLSTPFDDASADLLDALDVPAVKVGSGELTNLPFLARLAGLGRPLIVSTGMATMVEVAAAVEAIDVGRRGGDSRSSTACRPIRRPRRTRTCDAIRQLREAFGVQAGWSDHTPGIELPIAAVALGARHRREAPHPRSDAAGPGPRDVARARRSSPRWCGIRAIEVALGGHDKARPAGELEIATVAGAACTGRATCRPGRRSRRRTCWRSGRAAASPRPARPCSPAAAPPTTSGPGPWSRRTTRDEDRAPHDRTPGLGHPALRRPQPSAPTRTSSCG